MQDLFKHFNDGGWGMYPIILWLGVALVVIAERSLVLFFAAAGNTQKLVDSLKDCLYAGDILGAMRICVRSGTPVARVVLAGLSRANRSNAQVQLALDAAAVREVPLLARRTAYLAALGNFGVWSGILGTLTGLGKCSCCCCGGESVDPSQKARILAEGISEAMNCSAAGLVVAIVCILGYAILNGRTQQLEDDINAVSVQILNLVVANRDKIDLSVMDGEGPSEGVRWERAE